MFQDFVGLPFRVNLMLRLIKPVDYVDNSDGFFIVCEIQELTLAVLEACQPDYIRIGIGLKYFIVDQPVTLDGSFVMIADIVGQNLPGSGAVFIKVLDQFLCIGQRSLDIPFAYALTILVFLFGKDGMVTFIHTKIVIFKDRCMKNIIQAVH